MRELVYPFEEGDLYYTLENNIVVESVWDYQSEEMHDELKMYYDTLHEAILHCTFINKLRISLCFDDSIERYRETYGHLYY